MDENSSPSLMVTRRYIQLSSIQQFEFDSYDQGPGLEDNLRAILMIAATLTVTEHPLQLIRMAPQEGQASHLRLGSLSTSTNQRKT